MALVAAGVSSGDGASSKATLRFFFRGSTASVSFEARASLFREAEETGLELDAIGEGSGEDGRSRFLSFFCLGAYAYIEKDAED